MPPDQQIRFDRFRLDANNARLWRGDRAIALTPKAFSVLVYLLRHPDRLVTKEELLQAVWADNLVTDASLKVCVREIRKALHDQPQKPRFIETVHRRGYRFIGETTLVHAAQSRAFPGGDSTAPCTPSKTALAGREAELLQLHGWLEKALAGERQVAFVTGGPGSGKTALVDAFVRSIATQDLCIAGGQCFELFGAGEAYLPMLEALSQLCHDPRHGHLIPLFGLHAPTWLAHIPWLQTAAGQQAVPPHAQGVSPERMLREMAEALEELTARTPLVLVLEDLQWSDYSTLDLLSALALRRQRARLLLLATYRPVDMILSGHPLKAVKQELQVHGHCAELPLTFLAEAAVAEYLALRFPGSPLPPNLPRLIHQRTEGHPLFVVNVVDYLVGRGALVRRMGDGATWDLCDGWQTVVEEVPEAIRPLIDKQIERLNAQEQRLLEGASVAGVEFSAAAAAAAVREDVLRAEECCEDLARRHQFLQPAGVSEWPDGTVATRYRFRHELYHDVIYGRAAAARRQQLHQRIGERLEAAHAECAGEIAAELAMHFEQARDYARAARYLQQAADNASRVFAYQDAVALARRGLELLARLPDSSARARQELLLHLTLGHAYTASKGYADPETEQSFSRARELAMRLREPRLRFVATFGLACYYVVGEHLIEARKCSEELLQIAQGLNDPMLLMGPHFALGITLQLLGELVSAHSHFEQAASLHFLEQHAAYRAFYSLDPGVYAYCDSARTLTLLGHLDQGRRRLEDAMALARRTGDPLTIAHTFHVAVYPYNFLRDFQKGHDLSEEGAAYCDEHGIALYRVWLLGTLGFARVQLGDRNGVDLLREAIAGLWAARAEFGFSLYLGMLAEALFKVGQLDEALAVVADAFEVVRKKGDCLYEAELCRLQGELLLARYTGRQEEAMACFREARSIARRQSARLFELSAVISLSRLLHKQGKTSEARQFLGETYGCFTEGFDTPILREAQALLGKLA
jgi:DNA-binding winged helix-turn-helix (wHTH) protein/tetratricopeptide (TPR) repeat protein